MKTTNETLEKQCNKVLNRRYDILASDEIELLCWRIYESKSKDYCMFFKKIIDAFTEKTFHQAGIIAYIAAKMDCINCYNSIKKILTVNDTNLKSVYFAKKALIILDLTRVKNRKKRRQTTIKNKK